MDKKERLLNLAALLLAAERPVSALVVRRKVEGYPESDGAFHRAFERDKEDLREIGIPLVTQEIPGTDPPMLGYQIPQDQYYLPDPGLTADELAALHFATLAVQFGDPDHEALWKLGGVGMSGVPEVETLTSLEADANLVVIFDAILARQVIRFQYNNKERSLESWRLDYQRGRWYVSGLDHSAQAQRNYRLDRIAGAVETDGDPKAYDIPEDPAKGERRVLRPWEIGDGEPVAAELRVTDHRAEFARQRLGGEVTEQHLEDGSVVFSVPVINPAAFRSFALEFLDDAQIMGPPELRQNMIDWLRQMAEVDTAAGTK